MDVRDQLRHYDRRRHARVVKDIYAVYATDAPFREGLFRTENISGAGILFQSQDPLKIGTLLSLNIHLPDRINPIPCEAAVIRSGTDGGTHPTYDIGLAFTKMTEKDKKELVGSLLTQDDFYLFL